MKIVIPGGSGNVGHALKRFFATDHHEVIIISRGRTGDFWWDGKHQGDWAGALEGADAVINLAGRSVNCRYTEQNLGEMMDSRVNSVRAVGEAIAHCKTPPKVWLQASTATIYAHQFEPAHDERGGILGGHEPGVPAQWGRSIDIAKAWEAALEECHTPGTRKVIMRSAMTMSVDPGSIFDVLSNLTKRGLGGTLGGGRQYVSWIHERDFGRAVEFLMKRDDISGPVNLSSPNPLPQREFMAIMREVLGMNFGLPAMAWMVNLGARAMKSEGELVLKSRRVVPGRLLDAGFDFEFKDWKRAARELVGRVRGS